MQLKIASKTLGRTITFSRPGSSYIYADLNGLPGCLGVQLCKGGKHTGSTIYYLGDDEREFERICRNWYRTHLNSLAAVEA